jgi:predicted ATPase/DNA-binding winged helix-turn-helix (wHTH) protein
MRYVFGDCMLDTESYVVQRAAQTIPLRPKVFQVLYYLLLHRDRVISKQELQEHIWPAQFVSDAALEGVLKAVRQAVGDSRRRQWCIVTRRGQGYRFVAPLLEPADTPQHRTGRPLAAFRPSPDGSTPPPRDEPPAPSATWEQKPVVVLAIDLTFPTDPPSMSRPYDPWTVARRWQQAIREQVHGVGGMLMPHAGSPLLAAFGLLQTLDQQPQRAVQAALAIRQLVAAAQATTGQAPVPALRQALHLGPLLVQGQTDTLLAQSPVGGETLAVPVRLLGHAAPGEVLVSAQVARLVTGWCVLEACDGPEGARRPGMVGAYRVLELMPWRSLPAGPGVRTLSPFVGRARELATLRELLTQVEAGRGQVVGVVGEPGVGKSRLLDEFLQDLATQQVRHLHARCLSYGSAIPYLPMLDMLRANCRLTDSDSPAAITAKVGLSLQDMGLDPAQGTPYLLHLLGIQAETASLASVRPETLKAQTFAILRQLLLHDSRQQPIILAIEDVQWIDQTSEDFLALLADSLAGTPLLLLATYRPGYRPPWLEKSYATQLVLQPLTAPDSLRLVQALLQTEQVPPALMQLLLVKAEGNPFFLEELIQGLVEQGVIVHAPEGGMTLATPWLTHPPQAIQLPSTVQGVLAARIDRLPAEAKGLLQTLAVIGRDFSFRLLTQVVARPEVELRQWLFTLQKAEFLYERPTVPESEYTFKHALTQEVAYDALSWERRREVHERTAQALEALFPDRLEKHYSTLAHHYSRSGNTTKALDYLRRAGHQAMQQSAYTEAISHWTTALTLLNTLPDTPERPQHELSLLLALVPALDVTKGYAALEQERLLTRAEVLCQQVGEPAQHFAVLERLHAFRFLRAELQAAQTVAEQLLDLARRQPDPAWLLEAHDALGLTLYYMGAFTTARTHVEQGIALYDPQQHATVQTTHGPGNHGVRGHAMWSRLLWVLGYPDQALRRGHEALTMAQALAHPFSLADTLLWSTMLHQHRREWHTAQEHAEALLALATEQGFAFYVARAAFYRGTALAAQGRGEEGLTQMCQGLAALRDTGIDLAMSFYLTQLAEAYGRVGQIEQGLHLLAEARAMVDKTAERYHEAELHRLHGELLRRQAVPDMQMAEACFLHALAIARRQEAKSLELRAVMSLSRLWERQGKGEEARQILAEIYGWFTEGFDTADLQEARELLARLA